MNKENRKKVWNKCKELGRCICSLPTNPIPCHCPYFTKYNICKCNGEKLKEGHTMKDWQDYNLLTNN